MTKVSKKRQASARAPEAAGLGARARSKLEKRERIRRAAWELFRTQGYAATTTKQIAEAAGVATGTLFLYARDKSDLLSLVFHDRLSRTVEERFNTMPAKGPLLDQLMHLFEGLYVMYEDGPSVGIEFVRALPGANGPNGEAVAAFTFAFFHRLAALVKAAQARGEVDPAINPDVAANNIFTLYFGTLIGWASGFVERPTHLTPLLAASLDLQMRGLLARPGPPVPGG